MLTLEMFGLTEGGDSGFTCDQPIDIYLDSGPKCGGRMVYAGVGDSQGPTPLYGKCVKCGAGDVLDHVP